MNRIRLLHIVPHLRPGGAERVAVHMMRDLDQERFDVRALSLGPRCASDLERMLDSSGIPVWFLDKHPGFDPRMFGRVHRVLAEFRPDVIHTHVHVLRYTLPSTLCRPAPVMVHTVHNLAEKEVEPRAQWLQKLAFRRGGIVPVGVAREVAESLNRRYAIPDSLVVPNCIPVDDYRHPRVSRSEWRRNEGFASDDVLFVCVARFEPQKNHRLLIDAFAAGPALNPRARLLLVGRGALKASVEQRVNGLGLAGKVRFLGLRTDVPDVLGAADVFVLSSDFEGNPLAVIEAMAAGLPVVSTAAGGVPELIETGRHGMVVPPGDLQGLANGMLALLGAPESRRSMGRAAAVRAQNEFDTPVMVRGYTEIYDRLLARAGRFPDAVLAARSGAGSRRAGHSG